MRAIHVFQFVFLILALALAHDLVDLEESDHIPISSGTIIIYFCEYRF